MARKRTARPTPSERAAKVAAQAELDSIYLNKALLYHNLRPSALPKIVLAASRPRVERDIKNQLLTVEIQFQVKGRYDDTPENAPDMQLPLCLGASYGLTYRVPSFVGLTRTDLDAFAGQIAASNAWSYWREFVQSMTSRMGLPPLTLPFCPMSPSPAKKLAQSRATE